MKKVLLIQLPIPSFNHEICIKNRANVPYAAGFLKSAAYSENLFEFFEIKILEPEIAENAGDAFLIEYIKKLNPDIIGFSLYSWNLSRSIYIANAVRKLNSQALLIGGGPEVPLNSIYKTLYPAFDITVRGAGEETFTEILKAVAANEGFGKINGISFNENGGLVMTRPRSLRDINYQSPYLLDFIDFKPHYSLLFTSRGCPYSCSYCCWGHLSRTLLKYPKEQFKQELIKAKELGVWHIYLIDTHINLDKAWFKEIAEIIQEINYDGQISFDATVETNALDPETAELFKKCNFNVIDIGLQSMSENTLKYIERPFNLKKWLKGTQLIQKMGFNFSVDLIVGLPYETPETFKRSVDFLIENSLNLHGLYSPLSVFPGSKLWDDKKAHGLIIQKNDPHLVLKTPDFSFDELKNAIYYAKNSSHSESILIDPLRPHMMPNIYLYSDRTSQISKQIGFDEIKEPVSRILLRDINFDFNEIEKLAKKLSNIVIMRIEEKPLYDLQKLCFLIKKLSKENSYNIWHILIDSKKPVSLKVLKEIKEAVIYTPNYLDYQAVYTSTDYKKGYKRASTLLYLIEDVFSPFPLDYIKSLDDSTKIIKKLKLLQLKDLERFMTSVIESSAYAMLFEFTQNQGDRFLKEFSDILSSKNTSNIPVFFENKANHRIFKGSLPLIEEKEALLVLGETCKIEMLTI